jgi:uncharacterized protein involved in type VI secretion and phage assembly
LNDPGGVDPAAVSSSPVSFRPGADNRKGQSACPGDNDPYPYRPAWFDRQELGERYGEEFVEALDAEASRLLGAENSTLQRMADERFPAEDLADASALLSELFRRWMEEKRQRR